MAATSVTKMFILLVSIRVWFAFCAIAAITIPSITPCASFTDIFTGCSGTVAAISGFALGTITGNTPLILNVIIAFLQNALLVGTIVEFLRGRSV